MGPLWRSGWSKLMPGTEVDAPLPDDGGRDDEEEVLLLGSIAVAARSDARREGSSVVRAKFLIKSEQNSWALP